MKKLLAYSTILMLLFLNSCSDNIGTASTEEEASNQTLTGSFTLADGNPMANASVTVFDAESGTAIGNSTTGADGSFSCDVDMDSSFGSAASIMTKEDGELADRPIAFIIAMLGGAQYVTIYNLSDLGLPVSGDADTTMSTMLLLLDCDLVGEDASSQDIAQCIQSYEDSELEEFDCVANLSKQVVAGAVKTGSLTSGTGSMILVMEQAKNKLLEWGKPLPTIKKLMNGSLCADNPTLCEELFQTVAAELGIDVDELDSFYTEENGANIVGTNIKNMYFEACSTEGFDDSDETAVDAIESFLLQVKPDDLSDFGGSIIVIISVYKDCIGVEFGTKKQLECGEAVMEHNGWDKGIQIDHQSDSKNWMLVYGDRCTNYMKKSGVVGENTLRTATDGATTTIVDNATKGIDPIGTTSTNGDNTAITIDLGGGAYIQKTTDGQTLMNYNAFMKIFGEEYSLSKGAASCLLGRNYYSGYEICINERFTKNSAEGACSHLIESSGVSDGDDTTTPIDGLSCEDACNNERMNIYESCSGSCMEGDMMCPSNCQFISDEKYAVCM
ncbi:MAG: carboxypeptidase regulatory-like domain-containing protein, partial [Deltaproteobacteria bacterium]|nr:carboxypeptidase regulatory-like domain-containing protein [Deltaproteobacteria bacterium]